MARPRLWIPRIPQIMEQLEQSEAVHLSRWDVEQLFQVGRSAALELMRAAGSTSPGFVSREALLGYVRFLPEGQAAELERQRRGRVAGVLQEAAQDLKYRSVVLAGVNSLDEWA